MSKYLRPMLIGAATGFVIAFALAFLFSSLGVQHTALSIYCGGLVGVFTAYILANLAGNRAVAAADPAQKQAALAFAPPPGKALLYLYREGFIGRAAGLNVTVDGKGVAQLKSPRFACIVLTPGPHRISAAFGGLAGAQNLPNDTPVVAEPGGVYAFKLGVSMGLIQNSIAVTAQSDLEAVKRALANMTMVAPDVAEV